MKNKNFTIILILLFATTLVVASNVTVNKTQNGDRTKISESNGRVATVTSSNFEDEVLNSDMKVVVDFYADWCGPCKYLSPIIDEIASEQNEIKFVRINTDKNKDLSNHYGIRAIPTLIVFEDGKEKNRMVGAAEKNVVEDFIK